MERCDKYVFNTVVGNPQVQVGRHEEFFTILQADEIYKEPDVVMAAHSDGACVVATTGLAYVYACFGEGLHRVYPQTFDFHSRVCRPQLPPHLPPTFVLDLLHKSSKVRPHPHPLSHGLHCPVPIPLPYLVALSVLRFPAPHRYPDDVRRTLFRRICFRVYQCIPRTR